MSKRGENIHKRKDGRWEARYPKGSNEKGRVIYGSVYGKTYKEAKEKRLEILAKGDVVKLSKEKDITFGQVLDMWMENTKGSIKGATENKYRYLIKTHILPELGGIKASKLSALYINSFLQQKLKNGRLDGNGGLSYSYVKSIMLVINAALKFAVDEQICKPMKTPIFKPAIPKSEIAILDVKQQKKLEEYLADNLDCTGIGILISLYAGLRCGEICALAWDDIDFTNRVIHVRHTVARVRKEGTNSGTMLILDRPKTEASIRDIPVSSKLLTHLMKAKEQSKSKYVVSKEEKFVSTRTYDYRYHRILQKCNVDSINYHALRHTFATRCSEAGVDVKSLSEILGHSSVGITLNTYVHSSMELKRLQLEKLFMVEE